MLNIIRKSFNLIGLFLLSLSVTLLFTSKVNAVNLPVDSNMNYNNGYEQFVSTHLEPNFYQ